MPDPSLAVEIAIKAGKAVIGAEEAARAEEKIEKGAAKIAREAKRAETEMERFAKRTKELNATPVERYAAMMDKLAAAFRAGKLTQEDYTRAVQRNRAELDKLTTAQGGAAGPAAVGNVTLLKSAWSQVGGAVAGAVELMQRARRESEEAIASTRGLDDSRRKLVQLAESPADLQGMLSRADRAAAASGVDRATAYSVLFQARSYGQEDEFESILGANEVIRADAAATLATKVPAMLGGKITGRQAINMALAAGKPSEVDAEDIAGSMAMVLEGGRRIGATPDESFAVVSALSAAFKSPQVAADRIKAITNRMAQDPGLRDKGIMEGFNAIRAMPAEQRQELLKNDQETNAAYEALQEFEPKIREIEAAVRAARLATGSGRDPLAIGQAIAGGTLQTQASLSVRQAEIGKQIAQEGALAGGAAARKAAIDRVAADTFNQRFGVARRSAIEGPNILGMQLPGARDVADVLGLGATGASVLARTAGLGGEYAGRLSAGIATGGLSEVAIFAQSVGEMVSLLRQIAGQRAGGRSPAPAMGAVPLN